MADVLLTAMVLHAGEPGATRVCGTALTPAAVSDAIRALDGADLHLEGPADATMAIAGGPCRFFVHATYDNDTFSVPVDAEVAGAGGEDLVVLTVSGRRSAFPAGSLLDAETAVAVALRWATEIALDASVDWRAG
jgi:hypothetical protein